MNAEEKFEKECVEADEYLVKRLSAWFNADDGASARLIASAISQHVDVKIALHIELMADRVEAASGIRP